MSLQKSDLNQNKMISRFCFFHLVSTFPLSPTPREPGQRPAKRATSSGLGRQD